MKTRISLAIFVAFAIGFSVSSVFAKPPRGGPISLPISGSSTCIAGFTASPGTWNNKDGSNEYTCTSEKPVCAPGTYLEGNVAAGSLGLGANQGIGYSGTNPTGHTIGGNGHFYYKCSAPVSVPVPK